MDGSRYAQRLRGLLDRFIIEELDASEVACFYVFGGECNYLLQCNLQVRVTAENGSILFYISLPNAAPVCNCLCIYLSTNLTRDLQGSNIGSCSGRGLAGGALAGSQTVLLAGGPGHAAAGHRRGQHVCTSI